MSTSLNSGVKFFTSGLANSYRKIESGLLSAAQKLATSIGISDQKIQEVSIPSLRELKLQFAVMAIGTRGTQARTSLLSLRNIVKSDKPIEILRHAGKVDLYTSFVLASLLITQKLATENLISIMSVTSFEAEDEQLSKLGAVTIGVTGGLISFLGLKAISRLMSFSDLNSHPKKIAVISSGLLISSVSSTIASASLSYLYGIEFDQLMAQLTTATAIVSSASVSPITPKAAGIPIILTNLAFAPSLIYAFSKACPLPIRCAALAALVFYQLQNRATFRYNGSDGIPGHDHLRSSELRRDHFPLFAASYGSFICANRLYPGLIGSAMITEGISRLAWGIIDERICAPTTWKDELKTYWADNLAVVQKESQPIWISNVSSLVAEQPVGDGGAVCEDGQKRLPDTLISMIMDYVDEDNFSRLNPLVVDL